MRIFMDSEFVEDGRTIKLFSLALVRDDGAEMYLETPLAAEAVAHPERFDTWLQQNVIPKLIGRDDSAWSRWVHGPEWASSPDHRSEIISFCGDSPEFWGSYADYDWVAFCQIFGRMIDLPKGFPMYCRDLKQVSDEAGLDLWELVPQEVEHYALTDARWCRDAYEYLRGVTR